MKRGATPWLVAINVLLALALAWLWLSPTGVRATQWVPPSPVAPQLGASSPGGWEGDRAAAARFAAAQERPLFSATRRPPAAVVAVAAVQADPLDGVHIYGMFTGSEGGGIIVRAEGKTRRLRVSESLGEWRLKQLTGTEAMFARGAETRVLSLVPVKQGAGSPLSAPPMATLGPPASGIAPAAPAPPAAVQSLTKPPPAGAAKPPSGFVIGGSR